MDVVATPAAPAILPTRKQVAICGTTPTRGFAPIGDPTWQIWTIGPGGKDAHRWDRLFEVHNIWPENFAEYLNDLSVVKSPQIVHTLKPAQYLIEQWRKEHGDTELTKKVVGTWESNVALDRDRLMRFAKRHLWMSSSISYCIVQAIIEGFTDIMCPGIDLESGEEYISQFVGCAHLLDLAEHLGITIHKIPGSGLDRDIRPYPERYETNFALTMEKKAKWLADSIGASRGQYETARCNVLRTEGAIAALRQIGGPAEIIAEQEKQHMQFSIQADGLYAQMHVLQGEASATEFYRSRYVWGHRDP